MSKVPIIAPNADPVARIVHRKMLDRGLHHKELSLKAGLGESYVRDLFRGKSRNPKQHQLQKLADALGVDVQALTEVRPVTSDQVSGDLPNTPEEVALIDLWRLLSDEGQDIILSMIAKMVTKHPRRRQAGD